MNKCVVVVDKNKQTSTVFMGGQFHITVVDNHDNVHSLSAELILLTVVHSYSL